MDTFELKREIKLNKNIKRLILIIFPFILAILVWGIWLAPETYWQRLISLIGGAVTIIVTFYIELEIFS